MVEYKQTRLVSLIMTATFITFVMIFGMVYATKAQLLVCFVPLICEGAILGIGVLIVFFRVPERWL